MKKNIIAVAIAVMLLEFNYRDRSNYFGNNVHFYYSIPGKIPYGKLTMGFL